MEKKTYIVFCEEYEHWGPGKCSMKLYQAPSLVDLICQLDPSLKESKRPLREFKDANGDGANYYMIKELKGNKLIPVVD